MNISNTSTEYRIHCIMSNSHYEAAKINVKTTGIYTLISSEVVVTHAAIYVDNFNPFIPSENLLLTSYEICHETRFRLTIALESDRTYILVVSTLLLTPLSALSVYVSGPDYIDWMSAREYFARIPIVDFSV